MNDDVSISRRALAKAMAATPIALTVPAAGGRTPATGSVKVLRYAFRVAETGFDPAQVQDLYSNTLNANIFEAPLEFAYLERPIALRPNTAAAMPEVDDDFRRIVVRLRPGIYFAKDAAFNGRPRELVAADYVYSIKRHYDPRWKSPRVYLLENATILGLSELRQDALKNRQPFDYGREVAGLRVLDRYTFELRFGEPQPRFLYNLADSSFVGAVAREVVEAYGDKVMEHPVGTGPYRLVDWKRSSKIVLERNPDYREVRYEETAPGSDAALAQLAARLKGRRLPMVDRIEVTIIDENQPRWLAFLNGQHDFLEELPPDFANQAIPNNVLAPNLRRLGIQMDRYPRADIAVSYFGMENPVVGGYAPDKVALRRAIALGVDVDQEIRLVRRNQAIPAQSPIGPQTWGYDPGFRSEMSQYDPARAKALLDLYGYIDRDGDGWREQPDGSPLTIEYATQPDQQSRQLIELWRKNMTALGIHMEFRFAKWPENLKASRAGKLMMWGVGWSAAAPDGDAFLALGYGPNKGQANHARFDLPAYNRLYQQQRVLPDGPQRAAVMEEAKKIMIAYMPYKVHVHRYFTDLAHPWVVGARRNIFVREFWKYVDIDPAAGA
ncbi:MAG TPA: ABC transporter substrate-binding protein [Burkholderiaceae bacterium]|nr:ABC transporter substrate-binding protein [Burkholderiaceae bacterium]HQR72644.1 ABC transporter substrate-binding protein [Burkholderiaceae bacterium]